jgi:hypothetical protein
MPFNTEQFIEIFIEYNTTVYPIQLLLLIIGIFTLILLISKINSKNLIIGLVIGFIWIWTGLAYHIYFFSRINKIAFVFGIIFIIQGLFFIFESIFKRRLKFEFEKSFKIFAGFFFIIFGLFIYPLICILRSNGLNEIISIGLPCPTTIYTLGILMLATKRFPKYLLIIPTIWAAIGFFAAINFGIYQDVMLLVSALVADICIIYQKDKSYLDLTIQ